ncbi:MAG: hypothetical protein WDO71_14295 [Bacteroidota bacterium]
MAIGAEKLLLKVPSVIIPSEFNFIINPLHEDIRKVKITATEKLELDGRVAGNIK